MLDCLMIYLTTFSSLQTLQILQKYISIYFARLNMSIQPNNKYQNIIQILESDDDLPVKPTITLPKQIVPKQNNEKKGKIYPPSNLCHSNSSINSMQHELCASYDDVLSFRDLQLTNNLNQHYCSIKQFLQYSHKNVLFIFGPSGCGKTMLTLSLLQQNRLHFEIAQERIEENQSGKSITEEYIDMLYRLMLSVDKIREKIIVFKDFPISSPEMPQAAIQKHKIFKQNAYRLISDINNRNKYIFILNTQIYSSFYILSEASEQKAINRLNNVSVIKMESYGLREMQKIINKFANKYHSYSSITNNTKLLDDIINQANGDARKALSLIYHRKLKEYKKLLPKTYVQPSQINFFDQDFMQNTVSSKSAPSFGFGQTKLNKGHQGQQKQQLKYSVFHTLGKFLYGKRYNIYFNPNIKKNKKNNDISCYYTEQQLEKLNPPFYFRPIQLFQKSQMDLRIFVELLQQNFLGRYGKVKDIANMYNIFRYFDSYLQDGISKFEIKEQLQDHLKELVTWGIVIYNKNTVRDNSFHAFQRSKNNISKKLLQGKLQLLKTYYQRYKTPLGSMKHKIKDIISYGLQLRSVNSRNVQHFNAYLLKLVEILVQNGKRGVNHQSNNIQKEMNIMQDQDEILGTENCSRLNKISQFLGKQVIHKSKLISMMLEDSDESDIDSQN